MVQVYTQCIGYILFSLYPFETVLLHVHFIEGKNVANYKFILSMETVRSKS